MGMPFRIFTKTLSARISIMMVLAIAALLTVALFIMFNYSRRAIKEEAVQKAALTLDATLQQIDNILLSVEQSAGNIYWDMLPHIDDPEHMFTYGRKVVEVNPYITGAAIAMQPYYYRQRGEYFMAYLHRNEGDDSLEVSQSPIIQSETFGNVPYTQQIWYTLPMETGQACWMSPPKNKESEAEAIITFSLPIYGKERKPVGVLAIDISLALLTRIVQEARPSPNSFALMLGSDGSYIIHPDSSKLLHSSVQQDMGKDTDPTVKEASLAMLAGEEGYKYVKQGGKEGYVFYKPFTRSAVPGRVKQELSWSIGIVYPEADIFGEYNELLYIVFIVAVCGLVLLFLLCQVITYRQLLPLRLLTRSAQRIAQGYYDEPIPSSSQDDEVGRLQDNFQQMQLSLAVKVGELEELTASLQERSKVLSKAYEQAQEANRVKTVFLHRMTNQMIEPVNDINNCVKTLHESGQQLEQEKVNQLVSDILEQGATTATLLKKLLDDSETNINP